MTTTDSQNPSAGPAALVASLVETLESEHASLARLTGHFERQIEALRGRRQDLIDEATSETSDEVNALARLKQIRDRQMRLLGRVLRLESDGTSIQDVARSLDADAAPLAARLIELRDQIRSQASQAQDRCRDLEFTLQYAVHLGRELLHAMQGVDAPPVHYTSKGDAVESAGNRSFLNRVG